MPQQAQQANLISMMSHRMWCLLPLTYPSGEVAMPPGPRVCTILAMEGQHPSSAEALQTRQLTMLCHKENTACSSTGELWGDEPCNAPAQLRTRPSCGSAPGPCHHCQQEGRRLHQESEWGRTPSHGPSWRGGSRRSCSRSSRPWLQQGCPCC